ncbi:MAG: hypothetical protein LBQ52_08595 [Helicobacteraceae bacterium]|nr:hypothetical protein [Helicobacteraceae bacterium]
MKNRPKVLANNPKEGDIFYFNMNGRYYFFQIVKTRIDEKYTAMKYQYYIVVFEKSYTSPPTDKSEIDLAKIYRVKDRPKNTLLYIVSAYETPTLQIVHWEQTYYEKDKMKIDITYWGNEKVNTDNFIPQIITETTFPINVVEKDGIEISPTPAHFGYIYSIIESDLIYKNKKAVKITAKYFKGWIGATDSDIILKIEKIIDVFEKDCKTNGVEKSLKKCIKSINSLDNKETFIYMIEAENIHDTLIKISRNNGFDETKAVEIIDKERDW